MPSICQNIGLLCRAARQRWAAAWCATLLISGCAPLPPAPSASSAVGTQASAAGNAKPGANEAPKDTKPWSWRRYDRAGSDALAKAAPKPPALSDGPDPAAQPAPDARDSDQAGMASWYGPGLHGRRTANGERFDSGALTAAHPHAGVWHARLCAQLGHRQDGGGAHQ